MDPIVAATAQALVRARQTREPASAAAHALPNAEAAYAVQEAVARELRWFAPQGALHWKSGGPSREAELTHAPLPPAGVWASPADAQAWPLRLRYIEAEIALRLGSEVDAALAASLDAAAAMRLVDVMCVSIELVESRWAEGMNAPALARLADLQSHGALVLGDWVPFAARDWARQRCSVTLGNQPAREFTGTHPLADPAFVLPAWLRHATRGGARLPAGAVVTTGTWCGVLQAQPGDLVTVEFDGVGSARVRV
jgi:2-keto-4-pentenoate hydratase